MKENKFELMKKENGNGNLPRLTSPLISVRKLSREFRSYKKKAGLWASAKSIVRRNYVSKMAVKKVSLKVNKGEILGLIGPNGAGKSTLIKILAGVLYPTNGEVDVMGYMPWRDRVRYTKYIGVVLGQKSQLWWDLPAIDSFEMNHGLYDIPDAEYKKRLNLMIKLLDVKEFITKPVRSLSLGERMRCEIIQSLLHNPPLVFFDEPTIGLDILSKERMRQFIKEINKRYGTTFIITTHDMNDIERLCERVVIINHGIIVYDGMLAELRKKFANRKIIKIRLSTPSFRDFAMEGCRILKKVPYHLVVELNLKKNKLRRVIDRLMNKYGHEVEDMAITDPPIEEIIGLVYRK